MRAFLIMLHRYSGLASMVFLAIAALTGCLLIFRGPIDRALNADLYAAPAAAGLSPTANIRAVERFAAEHPDVQVMGFDLVSDKGLAIPVDIAARPGMAEPRQDQVFLNPGDGQVIGARSTAPMFNARGFVAWVADLHFELLAGTAGRWFLGVIAIVWLLSNVAGLVLTMPGRGPFWRNWWRNWQFRRSSKLPRLLLDLHRASGLWLFPFLMILAASSVAFNFWAEAYAPAVTAISPLEHDLFDDDPPFPDGAVPKLSYADILPIARTHAEKTGLHWQGARMLYLPQWNFYGVKFSPEGRLSYENLGPVDHYFDGDTGAWRHQVDPYSDSAGLVMIRVVYPLHSGEIFGFASLALVFALGVVTFGQCVTGLYIWAKKRPSRLASRTARSRRPQ